MQITVTPPTDITEIFQSMGQRVTRAWQETAVEIGKLIEVGGRRDIANGGNFGSRWTDGFRSTVVNNDSGAVLTVTMEVPYWRVFQTGALIQGKPLLWIPQNAWIVANMTNPKTGKAPAVISVRQVQLTKRFHLNEVCQQIAAQIPETFLQKNG